MAHHEDYLDGRQADQHGFDRRLSERFDWSKSTIKTLLLRLVEKGCLTREKSGKAFVYSALLTQDQSLDLVVEEVKDKVCSKRIVQVLENLIQESDFTLVDLNQLQQVLEEKKAEAVETVPCNCM